MAQIRPTSKCRQCGTSYEVMRASSEFCQPKCRAKYQRAQAKAAKAVVHTCSGSRDGGCGKTRPKKAQAKSKTDYKCNPCKAIDRPHNYLANFFNSYAFKRVHGMVVQARTIQTFRLQANGLGNIEDLAEYIQLCSDCSRLNGSAKPYAYNVSHLVAANDKHCVGFSSAPNCFIGLATQNNRNNDKRIYTQGAYEIHAMPRKDLLSEWRVQAKESHKDMVDLVTDYFGANELRDWLMGRKNKFQPIPEPKESDKPAPDRETLSMIKTAHMQLYRASCKIDIGTRNYVSALLEFIWEAEKKANAEHAVDLDGVAEELNLYLFSGIDSHLQVVVKALEALQPTGEIWPARKVAENAANLAKV